MNAKLSVAPATQLAIFLSNRPGALARVCDELGKAEIKHFQRTLGHQNVPGLETTMRDALAVRGVERIQELPRQQKCLVER